MAQWQTCSRNLRNVIVIVFASQKFSIHAVSPKAEGIENYCISVAKILNKRQCSVTVL